jgi:hypothetical protein
MVLELLIERIDTPFSRTPSLGVLESDVTLALDLIFSMAALGSGCLSQQRLLPFT